MAFVVSAITAEVVTVASVATAVAELGVTLSAVGAITGSKDLMKVGGFLGLAGGVTSLASGAFGAASGAASGTVESAGLGADGVWSGMDGAASDLSSAASGASGAAGTLATADASGNPMFSDAAFTANQQATTAGNLASGASTDSALPTMKFGDQSVTPGQPGIPGASSNLAQTAGAINAPADTSSTGIAQWWDKQPPQVKAAVVQGGAGALGGLLTGWTQEQKMALDREALNLKQREQSNLSSQPRIQFQPRTGIIASASPIQYAQPQTASVAPISTLPRV